VLVLAIAVAAFDMYVLMRLKPDANQTFRNITFQLLQEKSASEIKPRVFYEGFPQKGHLRAELDRCRRLDGRDDCRHHGHPRDQPSSC
jgi:hypothetical protein